MKFIISKLNAISLDLAYLKEHIDDITLTKDDLNSLVEAKSDLKFGRTKRL